ncbi:FHA domain-containing protein [Myxococcota bacterium]|nr:FHA domain-containing protein [Myxococcota bacterium]
MSTVICKLCGRENRSHFKFCLGCGTELNRDNIIVKPEPTMPPMAVPPPDPPPGGQRYKMANAPTVAAASGAELADYLAKHGVQMPQSSQGGAPAGAYSASPGATPPAAAPPPMAAPPMAAPPMAAPPMAAPPMAAPPMAPPPSAPPMAAPPMAPPPSAPPMAAPPMAPPPVAAPPWDDKATVQQGPYENPPWEQQPELRNEIERSPTGPAEGEFEMADTVMADDIAQLGLGETSEPQSVACPECGNQVPVGFKFCGNCGCKITAAPAIAQVSAPAPAPDPTPVPEPMPQANFVAKLIVQRPDGRFESVLDMEEGEVVVGRETHPSFATDAYMSPSHARITIDSGSIFVEDLGSINGTYIRVTQEELLKSGDIFRIGTEVMRYKELPRASETPDGTVVIGSPNVDAWGRIELITGPDAVGAAWVLSGEVIKIGREDGDITFPEDGYVSGEHLEINRLDDQTYLVDLKSSNGTYLKIRDVREVEPSMPILMGYQLYRIELI